MNILYSTFPRTQQPPDFVESLVKIFDDHRQIIGTSDERDESVGEETSGGLESNQVLDEISDDLENLGFEVESSGLSSNVIKRPVFFGENGQPRLRYEIDAWHKDLSIGLEVEAGRAIQGNAVYRDLVQALVMVDVEYLILAVPQVYRYGSSSKNYAYKKTVEIADALYGHSRVIMPFGLCVIGY